MNRPDLSSLCAQIQTELRLQDWRVTARYVADLADPAGNPVYGLCERLVDNKTATILVRDPATPPPGGVPAKAPLEVLLHELAHLHFAAFGSDTPEAIAAEEQAVWALAEALYRHWGEPQSVRLIAQSLVGAPTRHQMIARASQARAMVAQATRRRSMNPKEYARALREALAMEEGEEKKKALASLCARMETDEPEPKSEKGESQSARAAEPPPPPEKKDEPAAQRAQVVTLADVDVRAARAAGEVLERSQLLGANAARMTADQARIFSTMPLAEVKAHIAALPPPPPAQAQQRAARVQVDPVGGAGGESAKSPEQVALEDRVDELMGLGRAKSKPIEVNSREMRLSHLGEDLATYLRSQRAAGTVT